MTNSQQCATVERSQEKNISKNKSVSISTQLISKTLNNVITLLSFNVTEKLCAKKIVYKGNGQQERQSIILKVTEPELHFQVLKFIEEKLQNDDWYLKGHSRTVWQRTS